MIPKIIHQIWSDKYKPLPEHLRILGETWKEHHPDWEYILWDERGMNDFIQINYPQYVEIWNSFPYDIQRWDSVRYLILNKMGGMYIDFDYEAIAPIDPLVEGKSCCFALEPERQREFHVRYFKDIFNNAMILTVSGHPFIEKIVNAVFDEKNLENNDPKLYCVLNTTGPWVLMGLYENLSDEEKEDIHLIPDKYVTPFSLADVRKFIRGDSDDQLEGYLEEAHAIHYYLGEWI